MSSFLLFAQPRPSTGSSAGQEWVWLGLIFGAIVLVLLVIYRKVRQGDTAQCVHGGASFVWPLIQDYSYMSLEPIQIEIPLRGALSMENIRVNVPSVFTVAVGTQPDVMTNA